jgi:hypothetical protein
MKKLVLLGACLAALASSPVKAQTGGADVVVVRVMEYSGRTYLTVERVGQEPEQIDFKWDSRIGEKRERASKGYLNALNKLYQQGYRVQATIPGLANDDVAYTTLVFMKGQ